VALPALAWGAGQAGVVGTIALPLINGAALVVSLVLARRLVDDLRVSRWAIAASALPAGAWISLGRDLTEPLAWCSALGGLLCYRRGRYLPMAVLFSLACLARETTLVVPLGIAVAECLRLVRRDAVSWPRLAASVVPGVVYVGWQIILWQVFDESAVSSSQDRAGAPLIGPVRSLFTVEVFDGISYDRDLLWLGQRWVLMVILVVTVVAAVRSQADLGLRAAALTAVALVLVLPRWTHEAQFLRSAHEALGLASLVLVADRSRAASVGAALLYLLTAVSFGVFVLRY
jgi:hypothetical protein